MRDVLTLAWSARQEDSLRVITYPIRVLSDQGKTDVHPHSFPAEGVQVRKSNKRIVRNIVSILLLCFNDFGSQFILYLLVISQDLDRFTQGIGGRVATSKYQSTTDSNRSGLGA